VTPLTLAIVTLTMKLLPLVAFGRMETNLLVQVASGLRPPATGVVVQASTLRPRLASPAKTEGVVEFGGHTTTSRMSVAAVVPDEAVHTVGYVTPVAETGSDGVKVMSILELDGLGR